MAQGTLTVEPINQPQPQVRLMKLYTTDSLSAVSAAGYLNSLVNAGHLILASDIFLITFSTGSSLFSLSIDANGNITATALPSFNGTEPVAPFIVPGNIQAGLNGTAGQLILYPATLNRGSLALQAAANSGNFANSIVNASTGQATSWVLADPAVAISNIAQVPLTLVSGNFPMANGTQGLLADSGFNQSNVFTNVTIPLTAAQFNNMYNAPVVVVNNPGANKLTVVEKVYLEQVYGTTQFAAGGAIALQYGATVHGGGTAASNTLAAATVNATTATTVYSLIGAAEIALASATNTAIYISNASGAFTTGDSTFNLILSYRIISV